MTDSNRSNKLYYCIISFHKIYFRIVPKTEAIVCATKIVKILDFFSTNIERVSFVSKNNRFLRIFYFQWVPQHNHPIIKCVFPIDIDTATNEVLALDKTF